MAYYINNNDIADVEQTLLGTLEKILQDIHTRQCDIIFSPGMTPPAALECILRLQKLAENFETLAFKQINQLNPKT